MIGTVIEMGRANTKPLTYKEVKPSMQGNKEVAELIKDIHSHSPQSLYNMIQRDAYKGITLDELELKQIAEAVEKAKSKQVFQGLKKGYDDAIAFLKKKTGF